MARARRKQAARSDTSKGSAASGGEFTCPECGKAFARAAALGAHRRRAHGVVGTTNRKRATGATRATTPTRRTRAAASGRRSRRDGATGLDRDALLQALFPTGVPAREAVIRAANEWLDQAEQLVRMT